MLLAFRVELPSKLVQRLRLQAEALDDRPLHEIDRGTGEDGGGDERAFKWKHNGLRHSYISYRVAQTQDVAKVSLEAGNSPQMIFKHYRELVRPKDAEAWFNIKPAGESEGKVVQLEQKVA